MSAVLKKEFTTYFKTITGYVFLGFFIMIVGFYFYFVNVMQGSPFFNSTLASTLIMLLILIPVLTMRLFAEETRQKTDQLLFTSPVSITEIVLGKFFAASGLLLLALLIVSICPLILGIFGNVPVPETVGGIIGYFLMGFCFISVGMYISSLTDNQIIAAVGTFVAMFFLFMIDAIASAAPATTTASVVFVCIIVLVLAFIVYNGTKNIIAAIITGVIGFAITGGVYAYDALLFDGIIVKILSWFSIVTRYDDFAMGIFDLSNVVYYITFSSAFIYFTVNAIEKRRWR